VEVARQRLVLPLLFLATLSGAAPAPSPKPVSIQEDLKKVQGEWRRIVLDTGTGTDHPPMSGARSKPVVFHLCCKEAVKAAEKLTALLGGNKDFKIAADRESNTIFLWANETTVGEARKIIERLEVQRELRIFSLKHANAAEVAKTLKDSFSDAEDVSHGQRI
jgi:hypothetical protein